MNLKPCILMAVALVSVCFAADLKWASHNPKNVATTIGDDGIVSMRVLSEGLDGAAAMLLPERGQEGWRELTCKVKASKPGVAYIQVKFFLDKIEKQRISGEPNAASEDTISLKIPPLPIQATSAQILLRIHANPRNVGSTAVFSDCKLESIPSPPRQPRTEYPKDAVRSPTDDDPIELVPGYATCSFNINRCEAKDYSQIKGTLQYREKGATAWRNGVPPVFIRNERALRCNILDLEEDKPYELKLVWEDCGKQNEIEREFRTKSAKFPVARTVVLGPEHNGKTFVPESGKPDAYIRYTAPAGFVLTPGPEDMNAIAIEGKEYILLEGVTVRGGKDSAIYVNKSKHIAIRNCDIAEWGRTGTFRPDLDGKHYNEQGNAIHNEAGIKVTYCHDFLAERNYMHDPKTRGTSWFYSHPAGSCAMFLQAVSSCTIRHNDMVGSDDWRWDDAVCGGGNFSLDGSCYADAEVYGNYFALGDDESFELDGGQKNARYFYNMTEHFFCAVSLASIARGPSYVYANRFTRRGDEAGFGGVSIKLLCSNCKFPWGPAFVCNNDIQWSQGGPPQDISVPQGEPFTLFTSRNNKRSWAGGCLWDAPNLGCILDMKDDDPAPEGYPPLPKYLPYRPTSGLIVNNSYLEMKLDSDQDKEADVTVTPARSGEFRVMHPRHTTHFTVTPTQGMFTAGKPVIFTVRSNLKGIAHARRNHGAFIVRMADGFSVPVSVTVDTQKHPTLLAKTRQAMLPGKIVKVSNTEARMEFDVPADGKFYLFGQSAPMGTRNILISRDDGEELKSSFHPFPFGCINTGHIFNQRNRPILLKAGKHTFRVRPADASNPRPLLLRGCWLVTGSPVTTLWAGSPVDNP
ncbi:MAG: right-handed parallel beta-helix repeat-containing protein [Victivallales bacterium]|nr:right-handed parallel beta-helix repeat-containing protein [Victivallales bacterium]